jgi:hypothetical protein
MVMKKDIIFPMFLECLQYITDTFWESVFEDLAHGKAPYGTYISKGFLCCSYKNKNFSYKIERKDSKQLHDEVYNLLVGKLGLLSHREKVKKRIEFQNTEEKMKECRKDWASIKKKNIRDLMIEQYVVRIKKEHMLSLVEARYLISILYMAMTFKVITAKDIDYSNGMINKIEGIDFVKRKVVILRDIYNLEVSFTPQIVMDKRLMSDRWEKYLKDITKFC